ncbi:NUDIX hydrolase [Streptomyces sedi]|uniref:NUDIX hydrolase n=1 Tax=Streptomyces sedi TaxID=555059 RepID=A0A5C4V6Q4_9ACTN|nr:NUDIX hydrolase [Streptomyces sedi]TNM31557.1 NUDIX hydrolase [Streptomyces sedi]
MTGRDPAEGHGRGVSAGIVVAEGRVLLVRRRVSEGELSWQFPAGKIEAGETVEEAAVRETREETGFTVKAVAPLGSRVHPLTGRRVSYVGCRVLHGTATVAAPDEIAEIVWVTRGEMGAYVPHGIHAPVREWLGWGARSGPGPSRNEQSTRRLERRPSYG